MAPTPEERIAARMREIIVETYERERRSAGVPLSFPGVPDVMDLADGIRLFVQREILKAQIDAATDFRAFAFVQERQQELNRINFEIAKKRRPR